MRVIYLVDIWDHPDKTKAFNTITAARCYLYRYYMDNYTNWYGEFIEENDATYDATVEDFQSMLERDCIEEGAEIRTIALDEDLV